MYDLYKLNDKKIKNAATKARKGKGFLIREDIVAFCSDGVWVRKYWQKPCGDYGWNKWILETIRNK